MQKCKVCGEKANKGNYCYRCAQRRNRKNNPVVAAYQNLKDSAKRRGKEFSISIEYFKEFCHTTEYIKGKGIRVDGLHCDRINEQLGYIEGNIQVLPNGQNVRKYLDFAFRDQSGPHFRYFDETKSNDEYCPY